MTKTHPDSKFLRFVLLVLIGYLVVASLVTAISLATGTHWWLLGWMWPLLVLLVLVSGVSLGVWKEN